MTRIEAGLVDMDGVLIDSEPVHFRMTVETLGAAGLPAPDEAEYDEHFFGRPDRDGFSDWLLRHHMDADVERLVAEKLVRMTDGFDELVVACDDGQWLARELHRHGLPLAIVSGGRRGGNGLVGRQFGLGHPFPAPASSRDGRAGKPDPDPFLTGAAALGVAPAACAVIEDAVPGLRAAEAAGMWPIVVDRRGEPERFAPVEAFDALDGRVLRLLLDRAGRGSALDEDD